MEAYKRFRVLRDEMSMKVGPVLQSRTPTGRLHSLSCVPALSVGAFEPTRQHFDLLAVTTRVYPRPS